MFLGSWTFPFHTFLKIKVRKNNGKLTVHYYSQKIIFLLRNIYSQNLEFNYIGWNICAEETKYSLNSMNRIRGTLDDCSKFALKVRVKIPKCSSIFANVPQDPVGSLDLMFFQDW